MKNTVLENNNGPIFTNILMTGSDEDAEGHHVWVETLRARGQIMITVYSNDRFLKRSKHRNRMAPLGFKLVQPLAKNAFYLQLTGLVKKRHKIFSKGGIEKREAVCNILSVMMQSEITTFNVGKDIDRIEQDRILIPAKTKQLETDSCFSNWTEENEVDDE